MSTTQIKQAYLRTQKASAGHMAADVTGDRGAVGSSFPSDRPGVLPSQGGPDKTALPRKGSKRCFSEQAMSQEDTSHIHDQLQEANLRGLGTPKNLP